MNFKRNNTNNQKLQISIEVMLILSAVIIGVIVVTSLIYKLELTSFSEIKTENLNLISSFQYLSQNSVMLTVTEKLPLTAFHLTVINKATQYSYSVTANGVNNYGQYILVGESSTNYTPYSLDNICAFDFKLNNSLYSFTKNCTVFN